MQNLNRYQFDSAIKPLRPAMVKAARARVGQVWAEDAVQEALLQAWTIIDRFDASSGSSAFAAWMREILEIVCRRLLQDGADRFYVLPPEQIIYVIDKVREAPDLDGEEWLQLTLDLEELLRYTDLTGMQSYCVHAWIEGRSQREIAEVLQVSHAAVWQHIQAAIRRLRKGRTRAASSWGWRLFRLMSKVTVYRAPTRTGSGLARESLSKLK